MHAALRELLVRAAIKASELETDDPYYKALVHLLHAADALAGIDMSHAYDALNIAADVAAGYAERVPDAKRAAARELAELVEAASLIAGELVFEENEGGEGDEQ